MASLIILDATNQYGILGWSLRSTSVYTYKVPAIKSIMLFAKEFERFQFKGIPFKRLTE